MTRIIALTSARGDAGTSAIALQLAVQLAQRGQRVCLLDALRVSGLMRDGVERAGGAASEAAQAAAVLEALLIHDRRGFDLLPGQSAWSARGEPEAVQQQSLAACLAALDSYDWVLLDALRGVGAGLLEPLLASSEVIVTVTGERRRLREGYALLKLLAERDYAGRVSLLVTRATSLSSAGRAFESLRKAALCYLDRPLALLGVVREDPAVQGGAPEQAAAPGQGAQSAAAQDLALVAARLLGAPDACASADGYSAGTPWPQPLPGELMDGLPDSSEQPRRELQQQVDALAAQVDELLGEIVRLRGESEDIARLVVAPQPAVGDIEAWLAARASGAQQLQVDDVSFPVYQLRRDSGDLLRVAVHGCDSHAEQSEPQSTSPLNTDA